MLSDKQRLFAHLFSAFLPALHRVGYQVTFGEFFRSDEQAQINALGETGRRQLVAYIMNVPRFEPLAKAIANNTGNGIALTLHNDKLAADLNLWKDGKLCTSGEYIEAGRLWKSLHPDCVWGGDFKNPDVYHFSLTYEGRK